MEKTSASTLFDNYLTNFTSACALFKFKTLMQTVGLMRNKGLTCRLINAFSITFHNIRLIGLNKK